MVKLDVAESGKELLPWALKKLERISQLRLDLRLPKMTKAFQVGGSFVRIVSSEFGDSIRITGGELVFVRLSPTRWALFTWEMKFVKEFDPSGLDMGRWAPLAVTGGRGVFFDLNDDGGGVLEDGDYKIIDLKKFALLSTVPYEDIDVEDPEADPLVGVLGAWARNGTGQFLYISHNTPTDPEEPANLLLRVGVADLDLNFTPHDESFPAPLPFGTGRDCVDAVQGEIQAGGATYTDNQFGTYHPVTGQDTSGPSFGPPTYGFGWLRANSHFAVRHLGVGALEATDFDGSVLQTEQVFVPAGTDLPIGMTCDDKHVLTVHVDVVNFGDLNDPVNAVHAALYSVRRGEDGSWGLGPPRDVTAGLMAQTSVADLLNYTRAADGYGIFALEPRLSNEFVHVV